MSARGFGPVIWAGAVAGAALSFYLVSLRVASERAALEDVETQIALAQRDIRVLQTELGTRGRLAQLERWNVRFIRLSAPNADQFVDGGFQLATLIRPERAPAIEAPVVLASAPVEEQTATVAPPSEPAADPHPAPRASGTAGDMMHIASFTPATRSTDGSKSEKLQDEARKAPKTEPKAPETKATTKAPAKPATKPMKSATADPLAPLSAASGAGKGRASALTAKSAKEPAKPSAKPKSKSKDSVTD